VTPLRGEGRLWTASDVAAYLQTSVSWVYQKAESGLIPCLPRMPGRNFLRFEAAAVKAYARGEWRPSTVPSAIRRTRSNSSRR
jgi:hypothetical protein